MISNRNDTPDRRMRTRYWGPFKQRFYSVCSVHFVRQDSCRMCNAGTWRSEFMLTCVSQPMFKYLPSLWFFVNNPHIPLRERIIEAWNFEPVQ